MSAGIICKETDATGNELNTNTVRFKEHAARRLTVIIATWKMSHLSKSWKD